MMHVTYILHEHGTDKKREASKQASNSQPNEWVSLKCIWGSQNHYKVYETITQLITCESGFVINIQLKLWEFVHGTAYVSFLPTTIQLEALLFPVLLRPIPVWNKENFGAQFGMI